MTTTDELLARLQAVEDHLAVTRVVLTYGPLADAGLAEQAAARWTEDGVYDWDADGAPHEGRAAVQTMLESGAHQGFTTSGSAHVLTPPAVTVDGDRAIAVGYSLTVAKRDEGFELWRTSAVRWELVRRGRSWQVTRRVNRLLDQTGAGRDLFRDAAPVLAP